MHHALLPVVAEGTGGSRNVDLPLRRAWRERQRLLQGAADDDLQRRFVGCAARRTEGSLSVEEVAIDLHVSPRRLRQLCTHWFGFPPKIILEIAACETIAQELLETRLPLSDIARRQGFREQAAFNRFFKRVTGESPGSYRASRSPRDPPDRPRNNCRS